MEGCLSAAAQPPGNEGPLLTKPKLSRGNEGAREEEAGEPETTTVLGALPSGDSFSSTVCAPQPFYLCERRNEAGDADQPGISEQLGHLGNPADIFFSVPGGESKVFVKAVTHIVPIEGVARDGVRDQVLFQSKTDCGFSSTRETCSL